MDKIQRIPLKQRLEMAGTSLQNSPAVYEITLEEYLNGMMQLNEVSYLDENFQRELNEKCDIWSDMPMLSEMPHITDELKPEEGVRLLYQILIEPFALMGWSRKEGQR